MADPEVVAPPLSLAREPEALQAAHGVGVPRGVVVDGDVVVGRRIAEGGIEAVLRPHQVAPDDALDALPAQVPEPLGVLEPSALDGDGDRVEGDDGARPQRRLLVDLDVDGAVTDADLFRQFADDRRDLGRVVLDELELLGRDSDVAHRFRRPGRRQPAPVRRACPVRRCRPPRP